jgi:hypothetical protein
MFAVGWSPEELESSDFQIAVSFILLFDQVKFLSSLDLVLVF